MFFNFGLKRSVSSLAVGITKLAQAVGGLKTIVAKQAQAIHLLEARLASLEAKIAPQDDGT